MMHVPRCLALLGALCVLPSGAASAQDGTPPRAYPAQIAAAEKSLRLDDARELRRWLDATRPAERGWEWTHLDASADTTERALDTDEAPIRLAFSPSANVLATVEGAVVRLWTWPDLAPLRTLAGHDDAVYRAAFDAAGRRLVTVSRDVTSRTWDVADGAEIARIDLANPAFAAATFAPDGALAATCAWERDADGVHGVVWLWDASTGEVVQRARVGVKPLAAIAFTPDGTQLVTGSWDGIVHVLDSDLREVRRIALPDEGLYNAVNDVAVHPAGALVAAAVKDRTARVFDLSTGALVATLRGHSDHVESVAFSPDGTRVATSSIDASVRTWSTADWTPDAVLRGARDTVRDVVWADGGARVVGASLEKRVLVWRTDRAPPHALSVDVGQAGTYSATFHPDGRRVAVACYDGWLRTYDARTGAPGAAWAAHPESTCHGAAYDAGGARLITCSWDGTARVWTMADVASHAASGEVRADGDAIRAGVDADASHAEPVILAAGSGVYACALSPDGTRAALSAADLQIWDVDAASRLHVVAISNAQPTRAVFSHDGALVASGWSDGVARVHAASDGRLVAELPGAGARIETVAFTDDDVEVVSGDTAGVVRVHPVRGGPARITCDTGGRSVNHVDVAGRRIAVGSDRLQLVDLEHGDLVLGLQPTADSVWHLSWSPDARRIATCASGTIRVLGE